MNILNIDNILNLLPIIFEYFVPGFLFLNIYCYLTSRKLSSNILIGSIAISYILKALCAIVLNCITDGVQFEWNERAIILSVIAILLSVMMVMITENEKFNKYFSWINHKSIHNDIFDDVIDYKNGTTLKLTCEGYTYIGKLLFHEEKGNDSWIVLQDYIIEYNEGNVDSSEFVFPSTIMIRLSDVKRIELYYCENNTIL